MMKKITMTVLILLLTLSAALAAQYRVITKEAMVRKDKRFFAPVVTRIPYGTAVEDQGREGDWLKVTYKGKRGWLHIGAVQEQSFQLLRAGRARETTQEEVALAGKGFTPAVEKAFKNRNPGLKYGEVDKIQSYKISDSALQAFIQAGKLNEPGGAQ
jgi:uncharacterized protein YgiM (DUF1202 family)